MIAKQPNVVAFFGDSAGRGELGCCRGGVPRGAPMPGRHPIGSDVRVGYGETHPHHSLERAAA